MKITDMIKAPFSLGLLGLVILLMGAVLLAASFNLWLTPAFDASMERMALLDALEGDITGMVAEMQLNEAYALYSLEYGAALDRESVQAAAYIDAEISALLDQLAEEGYFSPEADYGEDIVLALEAFNQLRSQERQTFEAAVASYQAGDPQATADLLLTLQTENDELTHSLLYLSKLVEYGRRDAQAAFPQEANRTITVAAYGLAVILLLALVGYQRVAAATQPLAALTNAIMAIGGGQYRPALLAGLLKKPGPAGGCARSLDALATGLRARNAGLTQEIEGLRQTLYESRRRRLKIQRPLEDRSQVQ